MFIGYGGQSLIWGLESYATRSVEQGMCSSEPRWGFGPLVRMTLHGASRPSFTIAGHGGRDLIRPILAVGGEAGLTLAFRDGIKGEPTVSPHTGVSIEMLVFQTFSHQEWLLPEYLVGGGVRYVPTIGTPGMCAIGRPQRSAEGERIQAEWDPEPMDHKINAFRKAAAEEYASVPAFLQLARELEANGAPITLVQRALTAACDELRHTALCVRALEHLLGQAVELDVPVVATRAAAGGQAGLFRLALESWLDGCLGEGLAATLARADEQRECDPVLKRIHRIIARDEQRHAELGWDILQYCLAREHSIRPSLLSMTLNTHQQPEDGAEVALAKHHHQQSRQRLQALCR
jgi:hypothetical protein